MKYNMRMFSHKEESDGSVSVVLGSFDDPESEYVMRVSKDLLPQLIATLKLALSQ